MKRKYTALLIGVLAFGQSIKAQISDSATRKISLHGAVNFRDIGGYSTKDGKHVKWGKIYRSAALDKLTTADQDTLLARHIHTVIDFRGNAESAKAKDLLPNGMSYTLSPAGSDKLPTALDIPKLLDGSYLRDFYGDSGVAYFADRYRPLFDALYQTKDSWAVLYHCTGGRDRTGMATALVLYALDVPYSTIESDYLASNYYLKPLNQSLYAGFASAMQQPLDTVVAKMELKPIYLQIFFATIQKHYGSVDAFLKNQLGLSADRLKKLRQSFLY